MKVMNTKSNNFAKFEEYKDYLRNQVAEEALLYFNNQDSEIQNIVKFEKSFLGYFGNSSRKQIVKQELSNGNCYNIYNRNYHIYAMAIYSISQYLDTNLKEDVVGLKV